MDHIQLPKSASGTALFIPLLFPLVPYEHEPHDDTGFEHFAQRKGYWRNGKLDDQKPPLELARIVQSWLYFGFLSEVLDRPISPADLTPAHGVHLDKHKLCSFLLPELLETRLRKLRSQGLAGCDETLSRLRTTIELAIDASITCDLFVPCDFDQYGWIMLSVKILLVTIMHVYNGLAPEHPFSYRDARLFPISSSGSRSSAAGALLNYMQDAKKMCPQTAYRICTSHNYMVAYYLMHLPHRPEIDHLGCSTSTCTAFTISTTAYRTKHVDNKCSCEHRKVDVNHISDIITQGKIPVVQLTPRGNNDMELSVKGVSPGSAYVALSHVWLDGLGNPSENSLPRCQLQRLHSMLRSNWRGSSDWLWIDTLCVPVGSGFKEVKLQAISSMASIYQDAIAVLVVDAEIEKMSRYQHGREFIGHILHSTWNSRCWTYQEAVLGRKLLFQTSDGRKKPHIDDVDFFPQMIDVQRFTTGQNKLRWFLWRFINSPVQHFLASVRFVYPLMPVTHIFTTVFLLSCGPQAWQLCREQVAQCARRDTSLSSTLQTLFIGLMWLTMATLLTLITLPASLMLILFYWIFLLTITCIYCAMWLYEGYELLPTRTILKQEMRLQLATDLVAQLRPTAIDSGLKTTDPERAASLQSQRFARAWNALAQRTATKPEDLHFIMADLTGLTASSLIDLKPEDRMRDIATRHSKLPLALLFDPKLARPECCDPHNPWLPSSPREHLLPDSANAPCVHLDGALLTIHADELGDSYQWMAPAQEEDENEVGIVVDTDPSHSSMETRLCRLDHQMLRSDSINECFLVDTIKSVLGQVELCRAIELKICRRENDSIYCSFMSPVEIRLLSPTHTSHEPAQTNTLPSTKFHLSINAPSRHKSSQDPIHTYEHLIIVAMYATWVPTTTLALAGILASQTTMTALYVGLAISLAICAATALVGSVVNRLHKARTDRRPSAFVESRSARWVAAWLRCLSVNFSYVEGGPKRWYHFRNWGKYW